MTSQLLLLLLTCGNTDLQDGTILALQGSNKVVARYTGSEITHVAVVVNRSGSPWVYEATPAEVRCVPLSAYYREIGQLNVRRRQQTQVWIHRPKKVYAPAQIACMKAFLEEQLGRRYSVKKYVRRRTGDGFHCAELAATTLSHSGRFKFPDPHLENPASLMRKVQRWYDSPTLVPIEAKVADASWCARSWKAWAGFFTWCQWACYETWTWCW
jgi:hypothetical protein